MWACAHTINIFKGLVWLFDQPFCAVQVMEAVMHGAGGMDLIDPLFQHVLASSAKARKVPVVMDEVFAGLWRLGRQSACHLVCARWFRD